MNTVDLPGDQVRIPDPRPGTAATVRRYREERAVVLHPTDFHRLAALEELVAASIALPAATFTEAAIDAHRAAESPGESVSDPAVLDALFGH